MSQDSILTLIATTTEKDALGVQRTRETAREIFCRVDSITRSEFFTAGQQGYDPKHKFTVFHGDYMGERTVVYEGEAYGVYRTYWPPGSDDMELYAERKGGAHGPVTESAGGSAGGGDPEHSG